MRAGRTTLTAIADELNNQGITTMRGKGWHASGVREILKNEDNYRGGNRWENPVTWPVILE